MNNPVTIGAIYGGAGAPLLASINSKMIPKWIIEPRPTFNIKTHRTNFPMIAWSDQIKNFYFDPTDVIWGSPSCGEFSSVNKSSKHKAKVVQKEFDEFEYYQFVYEIKERKPKIFILENLPSIKTFVSFQSTPGGTVLKHQITGEELELSDYYIEEHMISPTDVGFPQKRNRLFVIGSLFPYRFFLKPPLEEYTDLSVRSIFEMLEEKRNSGIQLFNDKFPKHSEDIIERMKRTRPGESVYSGTNQKRIDPDKPAPVIMSSSTKYIHPWEHRVLTVRESACLMGYPLDFKFFGSESKCLDQIGKGIVVHVGEFILKQVYEYLSKVEL